ncbi:MAG: peptide chain release factor N(5)-glutamine methyltransferase [Candidatus Kerfeldbacteria bacterium]|nr:peptide chain release factor N(5)-glutamine methyltransferase [Candidatus Kerfeldbacteria bacterium]
MNIKQHIAIASQKLNASSTTPLLDTEMLMGHVLEKTKAYLLAHGDIEVSTDETERFFALVEERATGKPMAYIIGHKEFYGREFFVDSRVLIPRPETEMIIDEVLERYDATAALRILDLGTGSGCIGITLKKEIPSSAVVATDVSADALTVARKNAKHWNADIDFRLGDLFEALHNTDGFEMIISNPPYVDTKTQPSILQTQSLSFEPSIALSPTNNDSFFIIHHILLEARKWLQPTGLLLLEIGYNHGMRAQETARHYFPNKKITVKKDLAGHDRLLIVE